MERYISMKFVDRTAEQLESWKEVMVNRLADRYESIRDDSKRLAAVLNSKAKGMTEDKRANELMMLGGFIARRKQEVEEIREEIKLLEKEIAFKKATADSPLKPILEHMEQMEREDLRTAEELAAKFETVDYDTLPDGQKLMYNIIQKKGIEELQRLFAEDRQGRFYRLVKQIDKKVGNATEAKLERNEHDGFDGWVKGDAGVIWLHTFIAGGWNIQREHYRTKVTAYKFEDAK